MIFKIIKKSIMKSNVRRSLSVKNIPTSNLNVAILTKSMTKLKVGKSSGWMPPNWETMWDLIKQMRLENPAAVDTMGAHCLLNPKSSKNEQAYQTLIGLMLSSQTKDEVTSAAMKILVYDHALSIDMVMNTSEAKINEYIS